LYLRHALRKLYQVEEVFVALDTNTPIGIAMLEELSKEVSYIFYIAVKRSYRRRGVASQLLSFCTIIFCFKRQKRDLCSG